MNTKTMKTGWFKTAMAVAAVSIAALGAHGAEMITVDKVSNHYPWDGKVDCVYTLSGLESDYSVCAYKCAFTLSVEQGGATVSKTVNTFHQSITGGTFTNTFDCTELFGAGVYPNGGIAAKLVKVDYVQLWAGGPYFALKNVGAATSSDYGYYFWWGDTTGYEYYNGNWHKVTSGYTIWFNDSVPANSSSISIEDLRSNGWVDSKDNLAPAHDAATVKWGAPWRMPTDDEISKLWDKNVCKITWVSQSGNLLAVVGGVTKGYETHRIVLSTAGVGYDNLLDSAGTVVGIWSSTPWKDWPGSWGLEFNQVAGGRGVRYRYVGYPIRPVRSVE